MFRIVARAAKRLADINVEQNERMASRIIAIHNTAIAQHVSKLALVMRAPAATLYEPGALRLRHTYD